MKIDSKTDSRTLHVLNEGMAAGLHIGAQLVVMRQGVVVADLAMGNARLAADSPDGHDVPMTPRTLMVWLSAGKPVTAVAIGMLQERGRLAWDDRVADHIPEFGVNGKEGITVRQLLTHTGGIRGVDTQYPFATWQETLEKIYAMKLERDWVPGEKAGYHTHTSWYVLGEIINRLTRVAHDRWIRENIFVPLGMKDTWLAMDAETYRGYGERMGFLYETGAAAGGVPRPLMNLDTELAASRPRPSASCRGPIGELARFYEMLRRGGDLDGVRVLQPETVAEMTRRQRVGMFDQTFRQTIDWGLGFIVNSAQYGPAVPYQFGPLASAETFGHGGSQTSSGFCDPVNGLAVGVVFNGYAGEAAHDKRLRGVLRAVYEDLGLG